MENLFQIEAPLGEAPQQYPLDEKCNVCSKPLSRYNPYVTCGPCRMRLTSNLALEIAERDEVEDKHDGEHIFIWERFPKRRAVRRGPLLPDTEHLSGWGGRVDGKRVKSIA